LRAGDHKVERLGQDYLSPIEVPAHKNAELRVAQAQPAERSIDMRVSAGAASVEAYLARTKALAPELRAQLEAVLQLYREMAGIEERKATLAEQMAEYRTRIDEINMQLVTLRNVKTAGPLSGHLAKKMREISERLQQATIKATDLQGELMACRIRMQDQLAELKLARDADKEKVVAAK
jgi:chromosome segregation ATPase